MQNCEINNVNYDGHKRNGTHKFKRSPRKNYRCDRIYGDYDRNF